MVVLVYKAWTEAFFKWVSSPPWTRNFKSGKNYHDLKKGQVPDVLFRVGPSRSAVRFAVAASCPGGRWWGLWLAGRWSCGWMGVSYPPWPPWIRPWHRLTLYCLCGLWSDNGVWLEMGSWLWCVWPHWLLCIPMYFTLLMVSDATAGYTHLGGPIHTYTTVASA